MTRLHITSMRSIVILAFVLCYASTWSLADACPLVTEYSDTWTAEEGELPAPLYGYGSAETCGTDEPVDIRVELKDPTAALLDMQNAYDGYGFIEAWVYGQLTTSSPEGNYTTNVQAWLDEDHFGCYDSLLGAHFTSTFYKDPTLVAPGVCNYASLACSSGTASCTSGAGFKISPTFLSCSPYARAQWLRVTFGGGSACLLAFVFNASGPGPCT